MSTFNIFNEASSDGTSPFPLLEVMGPEPSTDEPVADIFTNRKWTTIALPTEIIPGTPVDRPFGTMDYCIDQHGYLTAWKHGTRIQSPRRPGVFAKAQVKASSSSWIDSKMYQLAHALLASKLSYHEFSRTYRIPIRAIKDVVNSAAYLEAVKDQTQNVLDVRFFKMRDKLLNDWCIQHLRRVQHPLFSPALSDTEPRSVEVPSQDLLEIKRRSPVYQWTLLHLKMQGHPLYQTHYAFMADGDTDGDNDGDNTDEGTDTNATTTVPTHIYQALLRNRSSLKLDFKYKKFNGVHENDWFRFKKNLLSFLGNFGVSRDDIATYVAAYRDDGSIPRSFICDKIREFLSAHLIDEALDMLDGEADGFKQFMILMNRFEHLRLSRFMDISEKLYSGVSFDNSIDKLFRDYRDLNLMLNDFGAKLDHRLLIAYILRALPDSFLQAKSMIGMKDECTLDEARSILQSHADQLRAKSSNKARMALLSEQKRPRGRNSKTPARKPNSFPKTPGAECTKCGYKNHTAEQCMKTKGYKCRHCGKNHLERLCPFKDHGGDKMAMFASNETDSGYAEYPYLMHDEVSTVSRMVLSCNKVEQATFVLALTQSLRQKSKVIAARRNDTLPNPGKWIKLSKGCWTNDAATRRSLARDLCRRRHTYAQAVRRNRRTQQIKVHHEVHVVTDAPNGFADDGQKLFFIVDSGATCHIVNDLSFFTTFTWKTLEPITVANATKLPVLGFGDIVCNGFVIKNVQYCPQAKRNLLSVRTLADNGWTVSFSSTDCVIVKGDAMVTAVRNRSFYTYTPTLSSKMALMTEEELIHRRFGHPGKNVPIQRHTVGATEGYYPGQCKPCFQGKAHKSSARKEYRGDDDRRACTVYVDFSGPFKSGLHGHRIYMIFLHYSTHYVTVFPMDSKKGAELALQIYCNRHKDFDVLQCDEDSVLRSLGFQQRCAFNGLQLRFTSPHRHEFQGAVERVIRTLQDKARSMAAQSGLDRDKFWPYALVTASYLYNRTPTATQVTPYERRYDTKPDVSNVRIWGCPVKVLSPNVYPKNADRTYDGFFIGYPHYTLSHGTYTVYKTETDRVVQTRDVTFFEDDLDASKKPCSPMPVTLSMEFGSSDEDSSEDEGPKDQDTHMDDAFASSADESDNSSSSDDDEHQTTPPATPRQPTTAVQPRPPRKRTRPVIFDPSVEAKKPQLLSAKIVEGEHEANLALSSAVIEPKSWRDAVASDTWRTAMTEEWEAILAKGTVEPVKRTKNMKVIRCRWIFKWKAHELRAKARVVVLGFMQDTSKLDTYAPTASHQAIRLVIMKASIHDWDLQQLDVNTAFLNADAPEDTYMAPPDGLGAIGHGIGPSEVFKLKKSLYGMATSPLAWYNNFKESLVKYGLEPSRIEPCLYTKGNTLFVLVYVDDLLFTGTDEQMTKFKTFISSAYEVKLQGEAKHFCGITLTRTKEMIDISQETYVDQLLSRFAMTDSKPVATPMVDYLEPASTEVQDPDIAAKFPYRELIGSLMFLMTQTRPDLSYAMSALSRYLHNFDESHWKAAKRVLRYIKGTKSYALRMKRSSVDKHSLVCYSDSDWANGVDRKSVSGIVILLDGTPLFWYSKKQTILALSSSEAELVGLCEANKRVEYAKQLLLAFDIDYSEPVDIKGDNQASLLIAARGVITRTKHIDLRRFYIKDAVEEGRIKLSYVATDINLADICTKPVKKIVLERLCSMLFYLASSSKD